MIPLTNEAHLVQGFGLLFDTQAIPHLLMVVPSGTRRYNGIWRKYRLLTAWWRTRRRKPP
jgi:hypothetical protein